jgi:peptidoglycan hydrolase CwlO-like protein
MVQLILKNYKTIIKVLAGLFLIYWIVFVLTPKTGMNADEKAKIDSLNLIIKDIYKEQQKLDSNIEGYNKKIDAVDNDINSIKGQKTIVKEIYHEEINRAGNYTEPQLDSFFSARYHY